MMLSNLPRRSFSQVPRFGQWRCKTNTSVAAASTSTKAEAEAASTYVSGLPSPPGPSTLASIRAVVSGDFVSNPLYLRGLQKEYNSDVVQLWAFQEINNIFDPEIFMTILRHEWTHPHGSVPHTWPLQAYYTAKSPNSMPMMLLQGEEWKAPRQTVQQHMFSPKAADSYQPGINQVVQDAVLYLKHHPQPNDDLDRFLSNLSFEMLAQVLLDRRMGLLDLEKNYSAPNDKTEEHQFVSSAVDAFHALGVLMFKPPITDNPALLRLWPAWNKLETNMDHVWDIGMKWLKEAEQQQSDVAFVTKLAGQGGEMDRQERLVNLITLLQAGVDTTSSSLAWAVIELARRPEVQERLRQELEEVMPDGNDDYQREHKLPYLKAFMREVQRYSPSIGGNMRCLPYDIQTGDYVLKKDSRIMWHQMVYGYDPKLLGGDPTEFKPERWLAAEQVSKADAAADPRKPIHVDGFDIMAPAPILSHPLMTTGFGVGPRMCVGARVAQNQMQSFLSKIVRDFRFSLDPPNQKIDRVFKLLSVPEPFPSIRFEPIEK